MKKSAFLIITSVILLCIIASAIVEMTVHPTNMKNEIPKTIKKQIYQEINRPMTSYDWILTPAGKQLSLGDFPIGAAISPDHRYMIVTNDGVSTQSLQLVDLQKEKVIQTILFHPPEALFLGISFSQDGRRIYVSGGGNNIIRVYELDNGSLIEKRPIPLPATKKRNFYPSGIDISRDDRFLYVVNNVDNSISKIELSTHKIVATTHVGNKPYTVLLSRDGNRLYVSNWGESSVSVLDPSDMKVIQTVNVGRHPNAMKENPVSGFIYVADSDSDEISVIDPKSRAVHATFSLLPEGSTLTGSQPDSLAVSSDGKTLYVANAGNNDIAVINVDQGSVTGLIPTAWYPTGVFLDEQRNKLIVLNAKGEGSGPNSIPHTNPRFVGNLMRGTLSFVDFPNQDQLRKYTDQVNQNNHPVNGHMATIPRFDTTKSTIKHVIYVIRENRTYDQILGDMPKGNGDPSLVMFGKQITPNVHKLANQFVLFDNFYANAEVSAQGHNWTTAAKANDYVEKNWPANYSGRNRRYDFEGDDEATYPKDGFLWNAASTANVSFRDYGEFYKFGTTIPNDPTIGKRYDPNFMGWNLKYSDVDRFKEWAKEFHQFEASGNLPQLEIVRLPNDHTAGTRRGYWTPHSMVSQNDYALGLIADTVSHSKYWKNTAIFVTEDDGQAGVDHVDSHRTVTLVISPYTQTRKVDSTLYDTTSILRTMELILGMKPMTQYDASATPMQNAFTDNPNFEAYTAVKPIQSIDNYNGQYAPAARASELLDLSEEDKANENSLNHILWQATRGNEPYPQLHGEDNIKNPLR